MRMNTPPLPSIAEYDRATANLTHDALSRINMDDDTTASASHRSAREFIHDVAPALTYMRAVSDASRAQASRYGIIVAITSIVCVLSIMSGRNNKSRHRALTLNLAAIVLMVDCAWFLCALGVLGRGARITASLTQIPPQIELLIALHTRNIKHALDLMQHCPPLPKGVTVVNSAAFDHVANTCDWRSMARSLTCAPERVHAGRVSLALLHIQQGIRELETLHNTRSSPPPTHRMLQVLTSLNDAHAIVSPEMATRHSVCAISFICAMSLYLLMSRRRSHQPPRQYTSPSPPVSAAHSMVGGGGGNDTLDIITVPALRRTLRSSANDLRGTALVLNTTADNLTAPDDNISVEDRLRALEAHICASAPQDHYVQEGLLGSSERPPAAHEHLSATIERPPAVHEHLSAAVERPPAAHEHLSATIERPPAVHEHLNATIERPPAVHEHLNATIERPPAIHEHLNATIERPPAIHEHLNATI
jgi:hypothetical protein